MSAKSAARRLGQEVRRLREARELSQEQLAEEAGVHRTFIGRIERGETNLTLANIVKLAKALGVNPSRLIAILDSI